MRLLQRASSVPDSVGQGFGLGAIRVGLRASGLEFRGVVGSVFGSRGLIEAIQSFAFTVVHTHIQCSVPPHPILVIQALRCERFQETLNLSD